MTVLKVVLTNLKTNLRNSILHHYICVYAHKWPDSQDAVSRAAVTTAHCRVVYSRGSGLSRAQVQVLGPVLSSLVYETSLTVLALTQKSTEQAPKVLAKHYTSSSITDVIRTD